MHSFPTSGQVPSTLPFRDQHRCMSDVCCNQLAAPRLASTPVCTLAYIGRGFSSHRLRCQGRLRGVGRFISRTQHSSTTSPLLMSSPQVTPSLYIYLRHRKLQKPSKQPQFRGRSHPPSLRHHKGVLMPLGMRLRPRVLLRYMALVARRRRAATSVLASAVKPCFAAVLIVVVIATLKIATAMLVMKKDVMVLEVVTVAL